MSKYTKEVLIEIIKKSNCKTTTELRKVNEYAYKKSLLEAAKRIVAIVKNI